MRKTDDLCSGPAYLEGAEFYARQAEAYSRAREAAARLIGALPEDLALTQSTTHGINLGVSSLNWKPEDEVISATPEHPGCLAPLHALRGRFGVNLTLIPPPVTPEKIKETLTPRTRLVALSHVDWTTGEVLPLEEICALAREHEALSMVDGAQSVGNIPVDVPATGADMYAFTGHKWLLGPEGMGGLYVRPECRIHSPNLGYLSIADPKSFDPEGDYELHPGARRFESSTMSPALAGGFTNALEAASERGEAGLREIHRRAELLMDLLSENPRIALRSPRPARTGLVSFEVEGVPAKDAAEKLLEKRFVVRFIPEPNHYVRASVHLFNPDEELEALTKAIGTL
ncbi:MAG: aminotransferase class V-fold PLP-dependent enzyme [Actinomycetota bacterium]|nr:aminotransferase class V-fold PLP-dependent enzyme [Actinomycetota bacterium]